MPRTYTSGTSLRISATKSKYTQAPLTAHFIRRQVETLFYLRAHVQHSGHKHGRMVCNIDSEAKADLTLYNQLSTVEEDGVVVGGD